MHERLKKLHLSLLFAFVMFLIMLVTVMIVVGISILLQQLGVITGFHGIAPLVYFALVSLLTGTILAFLFSEKPLKPLRQMMEAVDQIASGDYSVRLNLKGPDEFRELSDKFNHMAEELGSVEMLRTDFISSFSHEFKTPIVSIRGFAKVLQNEKLSAEERKEYLHIIIEESERLSNLSENVLYLSKIENQAILSDIKTYNLTEQIRLVTALLDNKITAKHLDVSFEGDDYMIEGNESMLQQVWINLLDNAVKFSPEHGRIEIRLNREPGALCVTIFNEGEEIPLSERGRIFDKFYQADPSRSVHGNGLGLAIVRKIIDLHHGTISVSSSDKGTAFKVSLPVKNAKSDQPL